MQCCNAPHCLHVLLSRASSVDISHWEGTRLVLVREVGRAEDGWMMVWGVQVECTGMDLEVGG